MANGVSKAIALIGCLSDGAKGAELVWKWFQLKWRALCSELSREKVEKELVPSVINGFSTKEQIEDVEKFFKTREISHQDAKTALEKIRSRPERVQRDAEEVEKWLKSNEKAKENK